MEAKYESIENTICSNNLDKNTIPSVLSLILQERNRSNILRSLERLTEVKETEIHDLCIEHSRDLLLGVETASKLCDSFKNAREDVGFLQSGVQEVGNLINDAYKKIEIPKKKLENTEKALKHLSDISYAVSLLNKAQTQIVSMRHISALRTLNKVKGLKLLKKSSTDTSKMIFSFVPRFEEMIERQIEESLSEWLVSTRKIAEELGKQLFLQAENRVSFDKKKKNNEPKFSVKPRETNILSMHTRESIRPSIKPSRELNSYELSKMASMRQSTRNQVKIADHKQDFHLITINFSILWQFESVFDVLGKAKEYREKIKHSRKTQILQTTSFYQNHIEKFEALAGQLAIEKELYEHDDRFRSEEELQGLWVETISQLERGLHEILVSCTSALEILQVKKAIVLFIHSTVKCGFTHRSYELFQLLKENHWRFLDTLSKQFVNESQKIIDTESYQPLRVEELEGRQLESIGLDQEADEGKYPFSKTVPDLGNLVKKFVWHDLDYLEQITESPGEELFKTIDQMIHKVNEQLFEQIKHSTVMQTAILAINANFIYKTFSHVYEYFEDITGASRDFSAREAFMQLKEKCEHSIFVKIQEQVGTYLKMIVDFLPSSPKRHNWIDEMLMYIDNTAASLEKLLGTQLSSTAILASFQYISSQFIAMLNSPSVQQFNIYLIEEINQDTRIIEEFISRSPNCCRIPGLIDSLIEIKELIFVFVNNDLESLKDSAIRDKKYSRLHIEYLIPILEKFKEVKGKMPKQKVAGNVAKKLRESNNRGSIN